MKILGTQILKNLEGKEMESLVSDIDENGKEKITKKPLILRDTITNLLNMENNENRLTAEKKGQAWQIMKKLWDNKEFELTEIERDFVMDRAKIFYPPMTYGVLREALEGKVTQVIPKE